MSTPAKLYRFGISLRQLRFFHWKLQQQNLWKQTMERNIYLKWNCRVRRQLSTIDCVRSCWDGTHTLVRCFPSTSFPLLLMPLRKYVCKWTFRTFWKFNSYTFTTTKWEQSQFKRFYRTSLDSSCLWLFFLNNHVLSGLFSICYCGCCCRCCRMLPNSDSATTTTYEAMFTLLPLVCCVFICGLTMEMPKPKTKRFARHITPPTPIDFILKKDIILINDGNCCFCVVLVRSQSTIHNAVNAHPKLQTTTLNSSRQQKLVERSFIWNKIITKFYWIYVKS